jgi:hypothetical protein
MSEVSPERPESLTGTFFPFRAAIVDELEMAVDATPYLVDVLYEDIGANHFTLSQACEFARLQWGIPEGYGDDFVDGCLITYQLFLLEAAASDVELPEISIAIVSDLFEALAETGGDPDNFYNARAETMEREDEYFVESVLSYLERDDHGMDYRQKEVFKFGCVSTYDLLRHQFMTLDFQASLDQLETYEKPPEDRAA